MSTLVFSIPRRGPLDVVLRDRATQHDARVESERREDGVEDLAAHVVEVHVDAGGTRLAKTLTQVLVAIVETRVKAVTFDDLGALLGSPGYADDHAGALRTRDLAGDRSGRSRGA